MKPTSLISVLSIGTSILSSANAISLHKRQDGPPRVLGLELQRNKIADPVAHDRARLQRRNGVLDVTIDNLDTLYFLNASVGSPPQDVRLHLDTGSSDLWVNTPNSALCAMKNNPCRAAGVYSANSSSTYQYLGSYFNISYIDGSGASGDYVTDTVRVAGAEIPDLQFGIGYVSTSAQGILGIGYTANEVQVSRAGLRPYDNLPAKMTANGMITSNAYSLWLNNIAADTGSLLFGGVDRARYQGELVSVPVQKINDAYSEFFVTLTRLRLGSTVVQDDMALAVLLDTGSTLTYLPDDIVETIYNMTNAVFEPQEGVAFVPCALGEQTANMTFTFSEPASIAVPLNELVINLVDVTGRQLSFSNGVPACLFGIAPATNSASVLGDTFLRSAYVVYDLDNHEISMAQTVFNATTSDIVEISKGEGAVPAAVAVSRPVAAESGLPNSAVSSTKLPSTHSMVVGCLLVTFVSLTGWVL
ncbi:putative aspartic-type endopeptidase [Paramyrothecium foliicola]|nr:putative aspartic-type endopeptidase [Paramyrothecium foliicola]